MNRTPSFRPAAVLLGSLIACATAGAAPKSDSMQAAQARYNQERAACTSGQTHQTRAACLDEAASAFAAARRGLLDDRATPYEVNARKRCEVLPVSDRLACLARMDGAGITSGTVQDGGIYRELTVVETKVGKPLEVNTQKPAEE